MLIVDGGWGGCVKILVMAQRVEILLIDDLDGARRRKLSRSNSTGSNTRPTFPEPTRRHCSTIEKWLVPRTQDRWPSRRASQADLTQPVVADRPDLGPSERPQAGRSRPRAVALTPGPHFVGRHGDVNRHTALDRLEVPGAALADQAVRMDTAR